MEIQVATLVATLEAQVAAFQANMRMADAMLEGIQRQMANSELSAKQLQRSMEKIQIANAQAAQAITNLKAVAKALGDTRTAADTASVSMKNVALPASAVAQTVTGAKAEVSALNDVRDAAVEAAAAADMVRIKSFGPAWGRQAFVMGPASTGPVAFNQQGYASRVITDAARQAAFMSDLRNHPEMLGIGPSLIPPDPGGGGGDKGLGFLAAMGFGGGNGIRFGGGRWGGFGFGFGGRGAFGIPTASRGSIGALMGFGTERLIGSTLGIAGSMGGGLLGGGLLAAGALGTSAVGMGTDLAGIGQAAGDIKIVNSDLTSLNDAITKYGKNSAQASNAQAQLNSDLGSFSAVAKPAVLAAAQTAQGFKAMFDRLTGPAEKIGAEILNQAMHVGEKFLPTIGKFAAQNMAIIQRDMQPFFTWLQNPGKQGGLGIFTDLEKIFQKNLPTAIHAFTQAFELFLKIIDNAAHYTGGFMKAMDTFFTKWNSPQNWSKVATEINHLIGLFHSWFDLFKALGGLVFDLFKPAVGLGQDFANKLTQIVDRLRAWISTGPGFAALHAVFAAHKAQMDALFNIISALGPVISAMAVDFLKVEAAMSGITVDVFNALAYIIKEIVKIPFVAVVAGWVLALIAMNGAITKVGILFGLLPAKATGQFAILKIAIDGVTAAVDRLAASFQAMGAAATEGAAVADTAVVGTGGAAAAASGEVAGLRAGLLSLGAPEVLAALAASFGLLKAIQGLLTKDTNIHSIPPGTAGAGNVGSGPGGGEVFQRNGKWYEQYNTMHGAFAMPISAAQARALITNSGGSVPGLPHGVGAGGGSDAPNKMGTVFGASLAGENAMIPQALKALAKQGYSVDVTSGYRTYAQQAALYARYVNSGFNKKYIAAKPGTSNHETGNAVDVYVNGKPVDQVPGALAVLKKFGLVADVPGDHEHLDLTGFNGSQYNNPAPLPTGIPTPQQRRAARARGVPGLVHPETLIANAQTAFANATTGIPSMGQASISQARQEVSAAADLLMVLKQQQAVVSDLHGNAKQDLVIAREKRAIEDAIKAAKKDQLAAQKQINTLEKAQKELNQLGASNAPATTINALNSMRNIMKQLATTAGLSTPEIQSAVNKINKVLSEGIANSSVRQAVSNAISNLKQLISSQLSELSSTYQAEVSNAASALSQYLSGLHGQADNLFQAQTAAAVSSMTAAMNAAVTNMQIMVNSSAGSFLFGGSITQTPAQIALAQLQAQHNSQQQQLALTQAQQGLITANAGGNPQTIAQAQQALANAQYDIQVQALQDQASVQSDAATAQLKAAQDAYTAQQQALIDNYQTQRSIQQTAMDQQIAEYVSDMERYPADAKIYLQKIQDVWNANLGPAGAGAFALGGVIYTNFYQALAPLDALLNDLLAKLALLGGVDPRAVAKFKIPGPGTGSGSDGILPSSGKIPRGGAIPMASGGLVMHPTFALVGEAGPEAVIPLSQMGGGETALHVTHVIEVNLNGRQLTQEVRDELIRIGRSNKSIFTGPGVRA